MVPLFKLEDYKSHLIDYYCWPCDQDKHDERAECINRSYSDEYLNRIVTNTQDFIGWLLQKMMNELKCYKSDIFYELELPMFEDRGYYISNNCGGGWHADELFYTDEEEKALISMYLVKKFFGERFRVEITSDPREDYNPKEKVGCEYFVPIFSISGPLSEFDRIYTNYDINNNEGKIRKEKQKALLFVLRQIKENKQNKGA